MTQGISWIWEYEDQKSRQGIFSLEYLHSKEKDGEGRQSCADQKQIKSVFKMWKNILWFVVHVVKEKDWVAWQKIKGDDATLGRVRGGHFEEGDVKSEDSFSDSNTRDFEHMKTM